MDTWLVVGSMSIIFFGFFLPGNTLASMVWPAERDSNSIYSLTAGAAGAAAATVGSGSFAGDGHAGTSGK